MGAHRNKFMSPKCKLAYASAPFVYLWAYIDVERRTAR